eukprot:TRINITY_DN1668_c0_g1_i3.p1 TRINITY_DN1668_c0_g1~~TRINITY_DN1668_c0_g1_i3.p1  ORF type:complete len:657 (-),score=120.85 TRINITY_DN1668_c0_g1_i3:114-2084(-)
MNQSVSVSEPDLKAGFGAIRRSMEHPEKLVGVWDPEITDMAKAWRSSAAKFCKSPCMATRSPPKEKDGPFGDYVWKNYDEMNQRILNVASGLRSIGLQPGDKLGVYSRNNEDWVVAEQASYQQAMLIVSIYDTLGPDTCEYVINHAELTTLIFEPVKFSVVTAILPKCPALRNLIVMGDATAEMQTAVAAIGATQLTLFALSDIELRGSQAPADAVPVQANDLCTIMYTSGTTGAPKGVMLSHANIIACVAGAYQRGITVTAADVYLSYLPLSHIMERVILCCMWGFGARVAFYQGNPRKLAEDLAVVQPTVLIGVPRVFNLFHEKVMAGVKNASWIKRALFNKAYAAKVHALANGGATDTYWDRLVFRGIRNSIAGPRCRLLISGGAPLTPHIHQFLRIVFECPVLQGYGLTETAAATNLTLPQDTRNGSSGAPLPCVEMKLEDVPEMNYSSKTTPQQGEVLIRGKNVFLGYYKDEAGTKAAFTEDGWLHSGDIGQWNADGTLTIIDRRKNIFKLSQGEYIAAEKLENTFSGSPFISQIFIYGNSMESSIVAIVVPNYDTLVKWAAANLNKAGSATDLAFIRQVCADESFIKAVMDDMTRVGKAAKLVGYEFPRKIHVEWELFSIDNDLLTPKFSLRRVPLLAKYKQIISALYHA